MVGSISRGSVDDYVGVVAAAAIVDSVVDYIAVITSFTATGAAGGAGIVVAGADTAAAVTVTVTRSITTAAVSAIATWVYHRAYCGRSRSTLILSAHCLGVKPSHYCMTTIG